VREGEDGVPRLLPLTYERGRPRAEWIGQQLIDAGYSVVAEWDRPAGSTVVVALGQALAQADRVTAGARR
jgi:hypothetical protein